jgi:hypothetical protein
MDFLDFEDQVREFDIFLSGGAAVVPEPVYERDVRRHVETYGNRSQPGTDELTVDCSERVYFERIDIDLEQNTISVSEDLQNSDEQQS